MADSPEVTHAEELGLGRRLIGVFVSPGATFESVRSRVGHADWLVPLIIMAIVVVVTVYMTAPIIQKMSLEQMKTSTGQDEEMMKKMQTIGNVAALVIAPVGVVVMLFVTSLVLLALVRFILGGETTYRHVLAVNGLSMLVGIPAAIVTVPLMLAIESAFVQVGFGLLLPDSMAETFLARLLFNLNFFSIWQYALVAIGLGIVSGISTKKAAIGVFILFFLYALGGAALQGLAGGFGG